jgi:hypothetical protein
MAGLAALPVVGAGALCASPKPPPIGPLKVLSCAMCDLKQNRRPVSWRVEYRMENVCESHFITFEPLTPNADTPGD